MLSFAGIALSAFFLALLGFMIAITVQSYKEEKDCVLTKGKKIAAIVFGSLCFLFGIVSLFYSLRLTIIARLVVCIFLLSMGYQFYIMYFLNGVEPCTRRDKIVMSSRIFHIALGILVYIWMMYTFYQEAEVVLEPPKPPLQPAM